MLENAITPSHGIIILGLYGLAMILLTLWVIHGHKQTKPEFLLASRSIGVIPGAMSIAASWIWAPALFVSSSKTYQQGLAGLFWYLVPNVATVILFGPFAAKLRERLPKGYTLPQHMRNEYGRPVHVLYLIQFFSLQICCFAVEVFAGATLVNAITGLSFFVVAVVLVTIVLTYATLGGLRASVATDYLQMVSMLIICGIIVPWAISRAGGFSTVIAGLGGVTGKYANPINPWVIWSFGISNTVSLLSGPLGDQMQWQRAFALRERGVVKHTFALGGLLFACVPLTLCNLGFLASNKNLSSAWHIVDPQMIGPVAVANLVPHSLMIIYVVMLLSALCATLDSSLCAVASLAATDIFVSAREESTDKKSVAVSRFAMLAAAMLGLGVAFIWHTANLTILDLFLFYGTLRASTMIPTVVTLFWPGLRAGAVFLTILGSLLAGAPLMAAARFTLDEQLKADLSVAGSLAVVTIGIIGCWTAHRLGRKSPASRLTPVTADASPAKDSPEP